MVHDPFRLLADISPTVVNVDVDTPFWTWAHAVNLAVGTIAIVSALTLVFLPLIRRARKILAWMEEFQEDWRGTPERPGVAGHRGVMERLRHIDGEFANDGNGSLRASVDRLVEEVAGVAERAHNMETRQKQVQKVINTTADELSRSIQIREQIIVDMTKNGEAVWAALDSVGAKMPPMIIAKGQQPKQD